MVWVAAIASVGTAKPHSRRAITPRAMAMAQKTGEPYSASAASSAMPPSVSRAHCRHAARATSVNVSASNAKSPSSPGAQGCFMNDSHTSVWPRRICAHLRTSSSPMVAASNVLILNTSSRLSRSVRV